MSKPHDSFSLTGPVSDKPRSASVPGLMSSIDRESVKSSNTSESNSVVTAKFQENSAFAAISDSHFPPSNYPFISRDYSYPPPGYSTVPSNLFNNNKVNYSYENDAQENQAYNPNQSNQESLCPQQTNLQMQNPPLPPQRPVAEACTNEDNNQSSLSEGRKPVQSGSCDFNQGTSASAMYNLHQHHLCQVESTKRHSVTSELNFDFNLFEYFDEIEIKTESADTQVSNMAPLEPSTTLESNHDAALMQFFESSNQQNTSHEQAQQYYVVYEQQSWAQYAPSTASASSEVADVPGTSQATSMAPSAVYYYPEDMVSQPQVSTVSWQPMNRSHYQMAGLKNSSDNASQYHQSIPTFSLGQPLMTTSIKGTPTAATTASTSAPTNQSSQESSKISVPTSTVANRKANGTYTLAGEKIRRPPNAFLIYAKERRREILYSNRDLSNKEVSKRLGAEWHGLPEDVRIKFKSLSEEIRREHQIKYPGYYYSPIEARREKEERKRKYDQKRIVANERKKATQTATFGDAP